MKYVVGSWFNRAKFVFDRSLRMANLAEKCADAYGDAIAFETDHSFKHLGIDSNRLTYRQVNQITGRLAACLAGRGIGRFDRVGIYKCNHTDYFLVMLAAMRIGAIAVPVHGRLSPEHFIQYAAYTGCRAVYIDKANLGALDTSAASGITWIVADGFPEDGNGAHAAMFSVQKLLECETGFAVPIAMNMHDDALIVHTSGTTAFPKGVLHTSHSLIRAVRSQLVFNMLPSRDRAMSAAHLNHHITVTGIMLALTSGAPIFVTGNLDGGYLLEKIQHFKPSIFFAFPDIYLDLCRAGLDRFDLSSIRLWVSGGDAMHEVHIRQLTAHGHGAWKIGGPRRGSVFMEVLGTSEIGSAALIKLSTSKTKKFSRCVGRRSIFSPKVKIADESGNEVPRGTVGRLMVKGASLFKGYWNANDRLHGVMIDGWWWTGDVGIQDKRGWFYQIDREVDTVHTRHGPVYGLPIEEEALKCEDVAEAALIGIPHPARGTVPVLVAHSLSGKPIHLEQVLGKINAGRDPGRQILTVIDVHSAAGMPRGLTGKVLKRNLRQQHSSHFQT